MSEATYSCLFQIVDVPLKTRWQGYNLQDHRPLSFFSFKKKGYFESMPTTRKEKLGHGVMKYKIPKQIYTRENKYTLAFP